MRIRDCSSDVCASDLHTARYYLDQREMDQRNEWERQELNRQLRGPQLQPFHPGELVGVLLAGDRVAVGQIDGRHPHAVADGRLALGRGWRRGIVCQYE